MDNTRIFNELFKRNLNESGNAAFLEQVVAEHPCFSIGHYFLLQKTEPSTSLFRDELKKTALFFNNPHWLNFRLKQPMQQSVNPVETASTMLNEIPVAFEIPAKTETEQPDLPALNPEPIITEPVAMTIPNSEQTQDAPPLPDNPSPDEPVRVLTTDAMLFEPMHMVDYFASQGIKLSEEALSADKLGKQLKSFTEWLKTMKKIETGSIGADGAPVNEADRRVQQLAAKSNADNEVLTESMAEVLALQGKAARAIEVYHKLSLLNPAKSAYFAAKIDSLNTN